ncbi:MAG: Gfo/Idh/MocA family oxidoreductase [Chloroflexi bacterium]|nr:Gfo/Idh/MocA family oxidoreductase [Chloroflexota bacterium]
MTQSPPVRWGLLSTANINRRLIPAIRASARGELVGVASRTAASAAAYSAEWDIPHPFASYEAMLASDQIDAVYIPLPNHLHAEWSIKAMRAGKHVLCEKPFAISLAEVDEMTAVAAQTGRVLAEAFMYRHHPQTKLALEIVRSGRLGDVLHLQATFNFTMNDPANVRLKPEWGGGALWDVGIYPVSLAQAIFGGAPERVMGTQWVGKTGVDEVFSGQLIYSGQRVAHVVGAFCLPWHTYAEITGTAGRLVLTRPFVGQDHPERRMTFYPNGGEAEEIPVPDEYLYQGEVEDMHDAILDGRPTYLTLAETRHHIQTILALYESARQGTAVSL